MANKEKPKKGKKPARVDCTVKVDALEIKSEVHVPFRTHIKLSGNEIPPMKIKKYWQGDRNKSFRDLMDIDNEPNREGIPGDKITLKRLKDWLKRREDRPDIANDLYLENGRIKTRMAYKTIFPQNI